MVIYTGMKPNLKEFFKYHWGKVIAVLLAVFLLGIGCGIGIGIERSNSSQHQPKSSFLTGPTNQTLDQLGHNSSEVGPEPRIPETLITEAQKCQSCENDGFASITYNVCGPNKSLKYKVITNITEKMYFPNVEKTCLSLSSELWGIQDGDSEWQAMVEILRKNPTMEAWVNGHPKEECPPGVSECKKDAAKRGNGLQISYANSSYSRLYKSPLALKTCLFVENTKDLLWSVGYCEQEERSGVCVKRNCC